jgi:hypothetical protein
LLKLLTAADRLAELFGPGAGDPFGVVLALLPHLIFVVRAQGMVGVGSRTVLGLEGAILHVLDPGHFLEEDLPLLDEMAHGARIV